MMQMLQKGGVGVVTDNARAADVDNPQGYYEFEQVKRIKRDAAWLVRMRGRAVKMVSQLLYDLPATERYRIVFMERDMEEMLLSQETMLNRLNRRAAPRDEMKRAYALHLERLDEWLRRQQHIEVLRVSYNQLIEDPRREARRVSEFLGGPLEVEAMAAAVNPSLYRNRKTPSGHPHVPDTRSSVD
jgi:hypothetical protein